MADDNIADNPAPDDGAAHHRGWHGTRSWMLPVIAIAVVALAVSGSLAYKSATRNSASLVPFSNDPLVSCGSASPSFRASRLDGPGLAMNGHALLAALRRVERATHFASMFPHIKAWHLVERSDDSAMFISRYDDEHVSASLDRSSGVWKLTGGGDCNSIRVAEPGLASVDMVLDPPHKSARILRIFVESEACNSGKPTVSSSVVGPDVHADAHRIVVTAAAKPPTGVQTCGAPVGMSQNGKTIPVGAEVTVHLDKPVGDRKILDGTRYPYLPMKTSSG